MIEPLIIKVVNNLPATTKLPIKLVMDPEGQGLTDQDFIGMVIGVTASSEAEVTLVVELHEPHRYLQQGLFEFREFDNVLHVVQIEVIETYKPGMVKEKPLPRDEEF